MIKKRTKLSIFSKIACFSLSILLITSNGVVANAETPEESTTNLNTSIYKPYSYIKEKG